MRNAERRSIEQAIQTYRQQNRKFDSIVAETGGFPINDQTFSNYPTVGDLFFLVFEEYGKGGVSTPQSVMQQVTDEFNKVIGQVFEEYQIRSEWSFTTGMPSVMLVKHGKHTVPLNGLSLGETGALSLVLYLYTMRNSFDVYLIDEPEVHLNWHLEERLLGYFNNFCQQHSKQMIVVTHSRAIFTQSLIDKAQFLHWDDEGKVVCTREMPELQRTRLAGEAINIIKLGNFVTPTFFVEDDSQQIVVQALADHLKCPVSVVVCGNASNVKSLHSLSHVEGGWKNSYFLIDGDNQGNPYKSDPNFLHLDRYCIENYLVDYQTMSAVSGKSEDELMALMSKVLRQKSDVIFKRNKSLEFLLDSLQPCHMTEDRLRNLDVSEFMPSLMNELGYEFRRYVRIYIAKCKELDRLRPVFPSRLLDVLQPATSVRLIEVDQESVTEPLTKGK